MNLQNGTAREDKNKKQIKTEPFETIFTDFYLKAL